MNSQSTSRIAALVALVLSFAVSDFTWAQASQYKRSKRTSTTKKAKGDKVDISDLEKKYWAPKDTDFSVVQNRTYTKAKKLSVSLLAGPVMNDNFSEGTNLALSTNYFFDERHGLEFTYVDSSGLQDNDAITAFKALSGGGVKPDYGRIDNYYGLSYNWVPFYAKMSVLGKKIIYFDMVFSPGIGMTNYTSFSEKGNVKGSSTTVSFDVSQYYFLNKNIAVRVDYRTRFYNEDVIGYSSGTKLRTDSKNRSLFLFGLTYYH